MFPFQQWIQDERPIDMADILAQFEVIEEVALLIRSRDSNATGETDFDTSMYWVQVYRQYLTPQEEQEVQNIAGFY